MTLILSLLPLVWKIPVEEEKARGKIYSENIVNASKGGIKKQWE